MRVLFVTHNIPRFAGDAAGSFVLRLACALRDIGVQVDVIAPATNDMRGDDTIEGIRIRRVPYARDMTLAYGGTMAEAVKGSPAGLLAFLGLFRALRAATLAFVREARRDGAPVDVAHAHWWIPAGIAVWLATFGHRDMPPYIVTMHGSDVRLAQGVAPVHPVMRRVLGSAGVVTAVSQWLAATAERIAREVHIHVGPMPVDEARFTPDRAVSRTRSVLFVGRLNAQKGIADLLEALALPALAGVQLDVVGDGPDAASLSARAVALGVEARVRWHGRVPTNALVPLYRSCAVVAMPSRDEGLGLVAVEAQLCETPVVAYASGGLPDVVLPAHGGVLVPEGDVQSLATALATVIDNEATATTRGAAARLAMLERFSSQAVAKQYAAWYSQASSRAPVRESH